jgi:hypothetical protein
MTRAAMQPGGAGAGPCSAGGIIGGTKRRA